MPSADTLEGWIKVFADHGYSDTDRDHLEPEFEKVAIYATPEAPEHVARQKGSGIWISKMGKGHDIEHSTLAALEGELMGKVVKIMKRPCKDRSQGAGIVNPKPAPNVPGNTDAERMSNALRLVLTVPKAALLKEEARLKKQGKLRRTPKKT